MGTTYPNLSSILTRAITILLLTRLSKGHSIFIFFLSCTNIVFQNVFDQMFAGLVNVDVFLSGGLEPGFWRKGYKDYKDRRINKVQEEKLTI